MVTTTWRAWGEQFFQISSVILLFASGGGSWPAGQYGLPMPQSGCPVAEEFQWRTGTRTQTTEHGSHGSEDIHIAGIHSYKTDRITQPFCMKVNPIREGGYTWMSGRYCIYKADSQSCPNYFRQGSIYWDDAAPFIGDTIQKTSGTVPEGEYDRNTKIYFCCRNDGLASREIELPRKAPFYLLKWGDRCQEVKGMGVTEEWIYWRDESSLNLNNYEGLHPKVQHSKYPIVYTKLFYCYYQPLPESKTLKTALIAVYVIAGVVGLIVIILVLACLLQRIFSQKPKDHEENNLSNAARERAYYEQQCAAARAEPVVQYRPVPTTEKYDGAGGSEEKSPLPALRNSNSMVNGACNVVITPTSENEGAIGMDMESGDYALLTPSGSQRDSRPASFPPSYEEVLKADGRL